ncbi:hypothetical protein DFH07DRAFT_945942 [Mycena maculata]|uniref:Uncharacterized protein n=1 Tax=Mycena maculata TaxID=230809 RepID=A0AAD7HS11_9AGAR|nr:hypothetical protein DFH07DRAFT_945943 [Mycena maculata]KAJ7727153.1 hypothetical protein DFH07DRAFT_945942 [Mycena maculata]
MKSSLNGLQTHLRTKFPIIYRLYEALSHRRQAPPAQEEIDLVRDATVMDAAGASDYLGKVKAVTPNIGEWDQAKFEALLTEWIIAIDHPFDTVENRNSTLFSSTHTTAPTSVFPSATPSVPRSRRWVKIPWKECAKCSPWVLTSLPLSQSQRLRNWNRRKSSVNASGLIYNGRS